MVNLILSAVVVLVGIGAWVLLGLKNDDLFSFCKKNIIIAVVTTVLLIPANSVVIIPANTVGLKYSTLSGEYNVITEGAWLKQPILDKVYMMSTQVQTVVRENITGQTADAQWVNIHLNLQYRLAPENSLEVFQQFRTIEKVDELLIAPLTQKVIESVTTQYDIIDLLGEKRSEIYKKIEDTLKPALEARGLDFYNLTLIDTDAGTNIESAIEAEAVAKKGVETAKQAYEKAKIDAEQAKIKAQSEADVRLIAANAEAKSNELLAQSLTDPILRKMELEARLKHGWVEVQTQSAIVNSGN